MQTVEISLSVNGLAWRARARLVTLGMVTLGLIAYTATAGDKILFSDQPTAANPKDTKSAAELFRSWNKTKLETPTFDYSIMGVPTIPSASLGGGAPCANGWERTLSARFLIPGMALISLMMTY